MKKTWLVLLSVVMVLSLVLTACSEGNNEPNSTSSNTNDSKKQNQTASNDEEAKEPPVEENQWLKKYDPPITFTQNKIEGSGEYHEGDSLENNDLTRWIKDATGIIVEPKWVAPNLDTDVQRLNLGAASGELPDVIGADAPVMANLARQGALLPLDDLIEEHGSPLLKYLIEQSQKDSMNRFFAPFSMDGQIYAMPKAIDRMAYWSTNWIRKDILDELGVGVPQTLAELETVLEKYKAKYPNGTGFLLNKDLGINLVTEAYDVHPKKWVQADGKVQYGSTLPGMKEALAKLNEWYNKGYIDREFIGKNFDNTMATFTAGDALTWPNGAWWSIWWPFPDLWKNVPKAEMVALPTLIGPDGQRGIVVDTVSTYGVAINKDFEHPEAIVYLYNEMLDSLYRSNMDIRKEMENRGYTFKYPVTEVQEPQNPDAPAELQIRNYEVPGWGWFNKFHDNDNTAWGFQGRLGAEFVENIVHQRDLLANNVTDLTVKEKNDLAGLKAEPHRPKAFISVVDVWLDREKSDYIHSNIYPGVPTPTMGSKKAYLDKLESETFTKIIMGQEPLSAFDQFVTEWQANGGSEITNEINEWHQSVQ